MISRGKTKTGKWFVYIGIWTFAFGLAFSEWVGMEGTPPLLEAASIPMIIMGLLLIVLSNFFRKDVHG